MSRNIICKGSPARFYTDHPIKKFVFYYSVIQFLTLIVSSTSTYKVAEIVSPLGLIRKDQMSVLTKILVALIVTVSVPASAVAGHHGQNKDIVDVASANGSFKTLVAAVKAAGLVKTLKSKGPFTVFAPTDAAFAALPKGTIASLLKPENKGKLVAILTHHVLSGKVPAKAVLGKKLNPKTVNGTSLAVDGTNGVSVSGAKVTAADIKASNGVIHVIDKVLLP